MRITFPEKATLLRARGEALGPFIEHLAPWAPMHFYMDGWLSKIFDKYPYRNVLYNENVSKHATNLGLEIAKAPTDRPIIVSAHSSGAMAADYWVRTNSFGARKDIVFCYTGNPLRPGGIGVGKGRFGDIMTPAPQSLALSSYPTIDIARPGDLACFPENKVNQWWQHLDYKPVNLSDPNNMVSSTNDFGLGNSPGVPYATLYVTSAV